MGAAFGSEIPRGSVSELPYRARSTTPRRRLGLWRTASTGILIAAATILVVGLFAVGLESGLLGYDLRGSYLPAAQSVRHGTSPYPSPDGHTSGTMVGYVYPPQVAVALVPLTAVPVRVAAAVFFIGSLAALIGALALIGVRDLRCYAAFLLWAPAWSGLEALNISVLLPVALALAWRYRATIWPLAAILGIAVSAKLFLAPLVMWAAVTRGLRTAGLALAIVCTATITAWAAIGFAGFSTYPELLGRVRLQESYSTMAMAAQLGYGPSAGQIVSLALGAALIGATVYAGRRGHELHAFTYAIAASLVLTPVMWQNYLVVLVVPLALARPNFSAIWLLPVALWLVPRAAAVHGIETAMPAFIVVLLVFLIVIPLHSGHRPQVVRLARLLARSSSPEVARYPTPDTSRTAI